MRAPAHAEASAHCTVDAASAGDQPNDRMRRRARFNPCAAIAVLIWFIPFPAHTQHVLHTTPATVANSESFIAEAADRFSIPKTWIRAVIDVESHGEPRAVSPKGAIGLMQLMPKTYAALRRRHALGADAFDPHDNIMAGAAYLREMYDRFGASGFLAAYNAGPERFHDYLTTGRPLPLETRAYVAQLALRLRGSLPDGASADVLEMPAWQTSALFVIHPKASSRSDAEPFVPVSVSPSRDGRRVDAKALHPHRGRLFVSLSSAKAVQ